MNVLTEKQIKTLNKKKMKGYIEVAAHKRSVYKRHQDCRVLKKLKAVEDLANEREYLEALYGRVPSDIKQAIIRAIKLLEDTYL